MTREDSVAALLTKAAAQIETIEQEYKKSLHDRTIAPQLKIDIKNAC